MLGRKWTTLVTVNMCIIWRLYFVAVGVCFMFGDDIWSHGVDVYNTDNAVDYETVFTLISMSSTKLLLLVLDASMSR